MENGAREPSLLFRGKGLRFALGRYEVAKTTRDVWETRTAAAKASFAGRPLHDRNDVGRA